MTTNSLTERYVHEVTRRIPADQRDEVAAELRASIADTIEGGVADEREVLNEMGDPIRLAAEYADRPLALIGSSTYPAYVRLLKVLLVVVLPIVVVALTVIDVMESNDAGSALGVAIATFFEVGVQIAFWVTLTFALMDRLLSKEEKQETLGKWKPEDLPEITGHDTGSRAELGASILTALGGIGLIVWQRTAEPVTSEAGDRLQVINPDLWSGLIWIPLAGLAIMAVAELARVRDRRHTLPVLAAFSLGELAFSIPVAWWLWDQTFFNPAFLADLENKTDWTPSSGLYTLVALVLLGSAAWEIGKRVRLLLKPR